MFESNSILSELFVKLSKQPSNGPAFSVSACSSSPYLSVTPSKPSVQCLRPGSQTSDFSLYQWIGGKIYTGNPWVFYHEMWGVKSVNFPLNQSNDCSLALSCLMIFMVIH